MALAAPADAAMAVEIMFSPNPLRQWTGAGDLSFGGAEYAPGGFLDAGSASVEAEDPVDSFGFDLSAVTAAERALYLGSDHGPVPATVLWLLRDRRPGAIWAEAARFSGRVDETQYSEGVLTVTIRAVAWDVDKGETLLMDNATQQRLYPGDLGFGYAAQLQGRGGAATKLPWPPH